jgi:type I restriction enzyme S subunit
MEISGNGLPKTWRRVKTGTLCKLVGGFAFKSSDYQGSGIPVVRISNVKDGGVDWSSKVFWSENLETQVRPYLLRSGDVLISMTGDVGETCQVRESDLPALLNQRVGRFSIQAPNELTNDFLLYATKTQDFRRAVSGNAFGAIQQNVSGKSIEAVELNIPPLLEQRIIAEVLGLVRRAMDQQERLLALTSELKKALLNQLFAYGLRGEPQKQTDIGPVPKSWNIVPCEELCEMITVGVVVKPASHYVEKGIPAFRSFNVREDRLAPNDLVYFSERDNNTTLAKSKLRTGDVLVVRTGYPGTSCVVPREYDGANCIDLVIVRPKTGVIRSGFLSRFFNAPAGKRQAVAAKHGLAQQHLNVGAVKRTLVPVPTLEEQDEIDSALAAVQRKIFLITARKRALTGLFRTLLHQLMSAQIRVHDLDLANLYPGTLE